ncbi:hypothetical protein RJ640_029454, partial [Escallonia rubra]
MASHFSFLALFLFINLAWVHVSAEILFEDGYALTTVLDGNKFRINPHSVLPMYGSSSLIILDSSGNAFYTLSLSNSQENSVRRFAGKGVAGYLDGDSGSAMFNKPKGFAIDFKGNVYFADKGNHAIRKISKSGVTTIAGGYSKEPGRTDGPGRNASFSDDLELAFVPERCALMIADHGNKLIRQINLKAEDCARGSQSVLEMASAWALGLGAACLLGLIVGFVIRPYLVPLGGYSDLRLSETWRHRLISLERRIPMLCFEIKSAVVSSTCYSLSRRLITLSLSHVALLCGLNIVKSKTVSEKPVSLLDCDDLCSSEITKTQILDDHLKDLASLDGSLISLNTTCGILEQADAAKERTDIVSDSHGKIEKMIKANILGFAEQNTSPSLA